MMRVGLRLNLEAILVITLLFHFGVAVSGLAPFALRVGSAFLRHLLL